MRHGQSEMNVKGVISDATELYPLTKAGMKEVKNSVTELAKIRVDKLVSSPMLRACQTAEIIAEELELGYTKDKRLSEISMEGLGEFSSKTLLGRISYEKLGLEPWQSIQNRMVNAILEQDPAINTLLVSHSNPIRSVVAWVLGIGELETQGVRVDYATFTILKEHFSKLLSIGSKRLGEVSKQLLY